MTSARSDSGCWHDSAPALACSVDQATKYPLSHDSLSRLPTLSVVSILTTTGGGTSRPANKPLCIRSAPWNGVHGRVRFVGFGLSWVLWALLYFMFFVALAAEARAWLVGCTGYQNIIASMLAGAGAIRAHAKGA